MSSSSPEFLPSFKDNAVSEDPSFQSEVKSGSQIEAVFDEIRNLQDEILQLHSSLKKGNEQIRRDVQEFCLIGEDSANLTPDSSSCDH
ncbi:LANO_0H05490g1_1 [Lachancea nothofagi CBS 11611]|uniref:LANO_0H05490g1_1 n=1 Tax=Lachancea nothofagi CBS 11611 TaxID=1266666 RepID=A0A1G4KLP9_9SACH|nr:LANO_0H05490g1_1 [Lachancea nothofagi CBS 11611]